MHVNKNHDLSTHQIVESILDVLLGRGIEGTRVIPG